MNTTIKIFLISIFIAFLIPYTSAQQSQYVTKKVDGTEYYVYEVVSGEGLYAISKKFGISQAEINKANPKIQDGLKAGESILIPVSKSSIVNRINEQSQSSNNKNVVESNVNPNVEFVLHSVQRRQTLFGISRKYKVSEDAIIKANPQLRKRKMQVGEVLRIPIIKNDNNSTHQKNHQTSSLRNNNSNERTQRVVGNYITHKVAPQETLYAISRQYKVTVDAIIQKNPQLKKRNVQIGETLNIPVVKKKKNLSFWDKVTSIFTPKSNSNSTTQAQENPQVQPQSERTTAEVSKGLHVGTEGTYITHKVAPNETLYAISRKYNVSVDAIKTLNEGLEINNISIGTILKIPFEKGAVNTSNLPVGNKSSAKSTYKIAYLLPFMADKQSIDPTVEKFIEFYFGSLLAVNNSKNGDINFEVYTFDTEKTEKKIYDIINEPDLQDVDLIVGPAYSNQIPILADFAKRRKINTLIPFSSKAEYISSNPYLFQFNPDQSIQNEAIAKMVSERYRDANILFVENGKRASANDYYDYLLNVLSKERVGYNKVSTVEASKIESYLSSNKKNLVIYQSDEYQNAKSDLAKLNVLTNYDVTVLGQYSWRSEKGKKPKMIYIAPFKGSSSSTEYYQDEYEKYYGKMRSDVNPRWDLLGYDLTTYFLSTMTKDGFNFSNSTQKLTFTNGIQSDFKFIRVANSGGFVNHQLFLIEDVAK